MSRMIKLTTFEVIFIHIFNITGEIDIERTEKCPKHAFISRKQLDKISHNFFQLAAQSKLLGQKLPHLLANTIK